MNTKNIQYFRQVSWLRVIVLPRLPKPQNSGGGMLRALAIYSDGIAQDSHLIPYSPK